MLLEPSEKGFLILRQQMLKVKRKGIVKFIFSGAATQKNSLRYFCSNSRENPSEELQGMLCCVLVVMHDVTHVLIH